MTAGSFILNLIVTLFPILAINPFKFQHILDYSIPEGNSIIQVLPAANKQATLVISPGGTFTFLQAKTNQTSLNITSNRLPDVFAVNYFDEKFVYSENSISKILDLGASNPSLNGNNRMLIDFRKIYLTFGNYMYGIDTSGKGIIWDIQKKKKIRNSTFTGNLDQKDCGFINFMQAFLCHTNSTEYTMMPLEEDTIKTVNYNAVINRPFSYKNQTILGCDADSNNVYCRFLDPSSNSSSVFSIENIYPYPFVGDFKESVLPVPELQMVSVSLVNKTINFYDLDNGGEYLGQYKGETSGFFRPSFSNFTNLMTWQMSMTKVVILEFDKRYEVEGCAQYDYTWNKCAYCIEGYILNPENSGCIKLTPSNPKKPEEKNSIFLPLDTWNLEENNRLTNNLWFDLRVDFNGNRTAETYFYEDYDQEKNLIYYSTEEGIDGIQKYFDFTSVTHSDHIKIKVTFKKSMVTLDLRIRLKDSLRNGNLNSKIHLNSEIENSGSLQTNFLIEQSDPTVRDLRLNTVMKPIEAVDKINFYFFYVCRAIEILITVFLLVRPLIHKMQESTQTLWLFQVVLLFQILAFFSLISIYFFRWFDYLLAGVTEVFLPGMLHITDFSIEGEPYINKTEQIYLGKVTEYQANFAVTNKCVIEITVYWVLLSLSLVFSILNIGAKLSALRQTVGICILVPVSVFIGFNLESYSKKDKNSNFESVNIWVGLATWLAINFDILFSFSSSKYEEESIEANFFPKENSSFYIFGSFIFQKKGDIIDKVVPVKIASFLNMFKWQLFIALLVFSYLNMVVYSIFFMIWAFSFLTIDILLAVFKSFHNTIYSITRISISMLLSIFSLLMLLCSLEYKNQDFSFFGVRLLTIGLCLTYLFLWFFGCLYALYILTDFVLETSCWKTKETDKGYIVNDEELAKKNQEVEIQDNFKEDSELRLLRQKVKQMTPYNFWMFMRSQASIVSQNSQYYQAISIIAGGKKPDYNFDEITPIQEQDESGMDTSQLSKMLKVPHKKAGKINSSIKKQKEKQTKKLRNFEKGSKSKNQIKERILEDCEEEEDHDESIFETNQFRLSKREQSGQKIEMTPPKDENEDEKNESIYIQEQLNSPINHQNPINAYCQGDEATENLNTGQKIKDTEHTKEDSFRKIMKNKQKTSPKKQKHKGIRDSEANVQEEMSSPPQTRNMVNRYTFGTMNLQRLNEPGSTDKKPYYQESGSYNLESIDSFDSKYVEPEEERDGPLERMSARKTEKKKDKERGVLRSSFRDVDWEFKVRESQLNGDNFSPEKLATKESGYKKPTEMDK